MQEPLEERACRIMGTTPPGLVEPLTGGPVAAAKAAGFFLTLATLRVWGMKSTLSLLDQGLTAGAGFGVNLVLARWMVPEVYGAFAVAFAGFVFVSSFYSVLLLEPMSVMGPSRHMECLGQYFRSQIVVHAILVGTLACVILLAGLALAKITPGDPIIGAVMGSGLAVPFILLAWLVRRMCYVVQRPALAIQGSAFYLVFIGGGLFTMAHFGWLGTFTAFLLMGCGSFLASALLLWRLGLAPKEVIDPGMRWSVVLRENWTYGRWLVGSTILYSISTQTQTFFIAVFLGLGSAGILRAMQIPTLAMVQVISATALLVLPSLSYDFADGQIERLQKKTRIISMGLATMALAFAALLALAAGRVEYLLFGGKYASFAQLIPLLALVPVGTGLSAGYAMALRASLKPHFDLMVNAVAAPVAMVSAFFFIRWWGLSGAAVSMILSLTAYSFATWYLYRIRFSALEHR